MPGLSIEEIIRQAMAEGKFDDLPGKGKPLDLGEEPYVDPDWRLAYYALRDAGYSLPWIETRREIEASLEEARLELARAWSWRGSALAKGEARLWVDSEWRRAQEAFRQRATELNRRIATYNLEVPAQHFQMPPLIIDREIERLTCDA
jgi:DnaJ family protein C protein 28